MNRVKWTSRKYATRCRGRRDLAKKLDRVQRVTGWGKRRALDHIAKHWPELIEAAKRAR